MSLSMTAAIPLLLFPHTSPQLSVIRGFFFHCFLLSAFEDAINEVSCSEFGFFINISSCYFLFLYSGFFSFSTMNRTSASTSSERQGRCVSFSPPSRSALALLQIILVYNPILSSRFLKISGGLELDSAVKRLVEFEFPFSFLFLIYVLERIRIIEVCYVYFGSKLYLLLEFVYFRLISTKRNKVEKCLVCVHHAMR